MRSLTVSRSKTFDYFDKALMVMVIQLGMPIPILGGCFPTFGSVTWGWGGFSRVRGPKLGECEKQNCERVKIRGEIAEFENARLVCRR